MEQEWSILSSEQVCEASAELGKRPGGEQHMFNASGNSELPDGFGDSKSGDFSLEERWTIDHLYEMRTEVKPHLIGDLPKQSNLDLNPELAAKQAPVLILEVNEQQVLFTDEVIVIGELDAPSRHPIHSRWLCAVEQLALFRDSDPNVEYDSEMLWGDR